MCILLAQNWIFIAVKNQIGMIRNFSLDQYFVKCIDHLYKIYKYWYFWEIVPALISMYFCYSLFYPLSKLVWHSNLFILNISSNDAVKNLAQIPVVLHGEEDENVTNWHKDIQTYGQQQSTRKSHPIC